LTFGSLFSGIGGLDLGLERAGMQCRWQVEIDPYCRKVLEKHWPEVPRFGDIKGITELPAVDLICGGFPCQPVSVAGKRLRQADDRWLWPEFARVIRMVRPRYVLVENVPGLLAGGMGDVLGDLAALGYDAEWGVLSAADMGAPHLRKRVFVVADSARPECESRAGRRGVRQGGAAICVAHPDHQRPQGRLGEELPERPGQRVAGESGSPVPHTTGAGRRPEGSTVARETNGWGSLGGTTGSDWWLTEPDVGRVAHGVPHRVDRLRGLGNAVVPQCAEWLGRRILDAGIAGGMGRAGL